MKVIIVGGVAGGASLAARLRRLDEKAEIIIFEKGEFISYANCGLPYFVGGVITDKNALTLQTPRSFKSRFNISVKTFSEVVKVLPKEKKVLVKDLKSGEEFFETYDALALSPGAKPFIPPIKGVENGKVFTLRNIPDTFKIDKLVKEHSPKSCVVVGGGYIGLEMAENLTKRGIKVTIVEMKDQVLSVVDKEMAADVEIHIRENNVDLILSQELTEIEEVENQLELTLSGGKLKTDFVIMSVGIKGDTSFLEGAVDLTPKGQILVNDKFETSAPGVYAVGDAIETVQFSTGDKVSIPLAGPANKMGRIAAGNILGGNESYSGTLGTSVLKVFDQSVAVVGLTEETLKKLSIPFDKTYTFSSSHASYYGGAQMMSVKTMWDKKTLKILGCQIVGGIGVDKRIDVIATTMRLEGTVLDLKDLELSYAPPFSSAKDPCNFAGFVAENVTKGRMKQFFIEDVEGLKGKDVFLLDVRTEKEFASGRIEGFANIPLDSLRERLNEIPKGKKVYVHCHSGLRSYIATRILVGNGWDAYNLSGGYRLYKANEEKKKLDAHPCYF